MEVLRDNLLQCCFIHHKCHIRDVEMNPDHCSGKPATNSLGYYGSIYFSIFINTQLQSCKLASFLTTKSESNKTEVMDLIINVCVYVHT
jgi:hypothetical protein